MKTSEHTPGKIDCVILMSGSGSNACALLEYERTHPDCAYHVTALVTDAPHESNTEKIALQYDLPWAHCDLRSFYAQHGEDSIKLDTERRRALRDEWSSLLYETIRQFPCRFLLFAGFMALTNLSEKISCLNVHPGDLTVCSPEGERIYAGLHVLPVERAILRGEDSLRSSVILVQPYTGNGQKEMDGGPILGISQKVPIDRKGYSVEELLRIRENRVPGKKCMDPLREMALEHIERLKYEGDHTVFPPAASDFAAGAFRTEKDTLFYKDEAVLTVEYAPSGAKVVPLGKNTR